MMVLPPEEAKQYRKIFEPYTVYVDEIDRGVLRADAPDEAVEAFIKWFELMAGEKPKITRWTKK